MSPPPSTKRVTRSATKSTSQPIASSTNQNNSIVATAREPSKSTRPRRASRPPMFSYSLQRISNAREDIELSQESNRSRDDSSSYMTSKMNPEELAAYRKQQENEDSSQSSCLYSPYKSTLKQYSKRNVPTVSDGYNNLVQWYRNLTT